MRGYLLQNGMKIVVIAAAAEILSTLLGAFLVPIASHFEVSIKYIELVTNVLAMLRIVAAVLFWLAVAAVMAHLEALYRSRKEPVEE